MNQHIILFHPPCHFQFLQQYFKSNILLVPRLFLQLILIDVGLHLTQWMFPCRNFPTLSLFSIKLDIKVNSYCLSSKIIFHLFQHINNLRKIMSWYRLEEGDRGISEKRRWMWHIEYHSMLSDTNSTVFIYPQFHAFTCRSSLQRPRSLGYSC